jgi:hypothetical protein
MIDGSFNDWVLNNTESLENSYCEYVDDVKDSSDGEVLTFREYARECYNNELGMDLTFIKGLSL